MPVSATRAQLRRRALEATQALLGSTIRITDEAWQEPSRLPGWTRAHVATHLARNADSLRQVVEAHLSGLRQRQYASDADRQHDLEWGSLRKPLELQIDLDTSAGELSGAFNRLDESGLGGQVELSAGFWMPVGWLQTARLAEVVMHHIDLDCGFSALDVDADIARWMLEWTTLRIGDRPDFPALQVMSSSGFSRRIGREDRAPRVVHGNDSALMGWLSGRHDGHHVLGADDVLDPQDSLLPLL